RPPVIGLQQVADTRPGFVSVEWDVRDEHLDLSKFLLEYRIPGKSEWRSNDRATPGVKGVAPWNIDPGDQFEVRLRAADRAGNWAEAVLSLGAGADGRPITRGGGAPTVTSGVPEYVHTRTVHIKCNVSVGISGRKDFDLWYTRDGGRSWAKAPK